MHGETRKSQGFNWSTALEDGRQLAQSSFAANSPSGDGTQAQPLTARRVRALEGRGDGARGSGDVLEAHHGPQGRRDEALEGPVEVRGTITSPD